MLLNKVGTSCLGPLQAEQVQFYNFKHKPFLLHGAKDLKKAVYTQFCTREILLDLDFLY